MKHLFLLLILTLHLFVSYSQTGTPSITGFDPREYKGTSDVGAIFQNKRGLLYIGGSGGFILEYDGVTWKKIPTYCEAADVIVEDNNGNLLISDFNTTNITRLKPDAITGKWIPEKIHVEIPDSITEKRFPLPLRKIDSNIYCFSYNVFNNSKIPLVYKYDGEEFKALNITTPKNAIFNELTPKGNIAIAKDYAYLYDIETCKKDTLFINEEILQQIYSISTYSDTEIMLLTVRKGLWIYNIATKKLKEFGPQKTTQTLDNVDLLNIRQLNNGNWVLGTVSKGIFVLDNNGNIIRHIAIKDGLKSNLILTTLQDSQNQLWLGLYSGGLNRIQIDAPSDFWTERNGVLSSSVRNIKQYKNTYIASTVTHIIVFDTITNNWKPLHENVKEISSMAEKLKLADQKEHLFFGAYSKLFEITKINKKWKISEIYLPYDFGYILGATNYKSNPDRIYIWSDAQIGYMNYKNKRKINSIPFLENKNIKFEGAQKLGNYIWAHRNNERYPIKIDLKNKEIQTFPKDSAIIIYVDSTVHLINKRGDSVFTVQNDKDLVYNSELSKTFAPYKDEYISVSCTNNNYIWIILHNNETFTQVLRKSKNENYERDFFIEQIVNKYQIKKVYQDQNNENIVWLTTTEGILKIDISKSISRQSTKPENFKTYIRQIKIGEDSIIFEGNFTNVIKDKNGKEQRIIIENQPDNEEVVIDYKYNNIKFKIASPFFLEEKRIEFYYFLEGLDRKWIKSNMPVKEYINLPEGEYTLKVKSVNYLGKESEITSYHFEILPPWYRTTIAYLTYIVFFMGIGPLIFVLYTRNLRRRNENLENMVKVRTDEISQANEELKQQNEEILQQRDLLNERNKQINEQNKNILASINYAERIQTAMLSIDNKLQKNISDYFIFYKPKNIISGDFYWIENVEGKVIIAISDCTGHGVPGALMSMLGISGLKDTIFQEKILEPNLILEHLHLYIHNSLKQEKSHNNDGMDIAIIVWDKTKNTIKYAGAHAPVYILQNNQIRRIKGDRISIGGRFYKEKRTYTQHIIDPKNIEALYMASDGYKDQIGGSANRKFMSRKFEKLLFEVSSYPIKEQKNIIEKRFFDWKKGEVQTDDVLVFGMKF